LHQFIILMEEKIIGGALQLYLKYGIKSITMDDVARELGISKKTIYKIVKDKDDLVQKATEFFIAADKANIEQVVNSFSDVIEQMVQIGNYSCTVLKNLNPSVIYDMKKYHTETWNFFLNYKNTFFYEIIYNNITKGIKLGLYRSDIDVDIISKFYIGQIEVIIDDTIFPTPEYKFDILCREFLTYHMHGIATNKSIKLIDKCIQQLDK